jgi:hypothetical protein
VSVNFSNAVIKVFKNYVYEEDTLLEYPDYCLLYQTAKQMTCKYKHLNNIRDSHDVVCYFMILMNHHCAKNLYKYCNGIFRTAVVSTKNSLPEHLPTDISQFIKIWHNSYAEYVDISTINCSSGLSNATFGLSNATFGLSNATFGLSNATFGLSNATSGLSHDILNIDVYIHITSPIRRLVDLLNMIKFQENYNMIQLSDDAYEFYNKWTTKLDYINKTMRSIRKVQSDCDLLNICFNNPETLEKTYEGYCFDKLVKHNGLYQFTVFLPELKLVSQITIADNLENYDKRQFKLYIFNNEEKFKRKIRLQIM